MIFFLANRGSVHDSPSIVNSFVPYKIISMLLGTKMNLTESYTAFSGIFCERLGLGPDQDVPFDLILWYIAKIIPNV